MTSASRDRSLPRVVMRCSARRRPKASLPLAAGRYRDDPVGERTLACGYTSAMNRILLIVAVALFAIAALSAFSDDFSVNELGFLGLGLAAWAAAPLVATVPVGGRRRYARR